MSEDYCLDLNLSTKNAFNINIPEYCLNNFDEALTVEYSKYPTIDNPLKTGFWLFDDSILNKEWVDYINRFFPDFLFEAIIVFYRGPQYQSPNCHYDKKYISEDFAFKTENGPSSVIGLNWIYNNCNDSYLCWYKSNQKASFIHDYGRAVLSCCEKKENLTETARKNLHQDKITACRIDQFHNVEMGDDERWAVTLRIPEICNTWNQWVNYLKYHNIHTSK